MGIFKKIFDWTSPELPPDRRTVSNQLVEQKSPIRSLTETLPTPVVSAPGLAAINSSGPELVPYLVENSRALEAPTQYPFTTSLEWKQERTDRLHCGDLDRLPSREEGFVDQVVDAFDEAFDRACRSDTMPTDSSSTAGLVQNDGDEATVQDLFAQIAANYSKPLRNFAFELRCGTASKDHIEFLRPSLQMIGDAAAKMDLAQAVQRITDFDEVLSMAQAIPARLLECEARLLILESYNEMNKVLPEIFQTGEDEQKREDIIIKSLLQQIPGVGRVTLDKLYRAGLGSLHALFLANKEDLAAATTIPAPLCERIADKFQEYRAEVPGILQQDPQSGYHARLNCLVAELRCRHEEVESTSAMTALNAALANEHGRRRQLRQQCSLQIIATLAELGEVDLIHKIQRLSFRQKLKRLEDHLETLDGDLRRGPMHSAELVIEPKS